MTEDGRAPATRKAATVDGAPVPTVLADAVERLITTVFGGWPTTRPEPHQPNPQPAEEV